MSRQKSQVTELRIELGTENSSLIFAAEEKKYIYIDITCQEYDVFKIFIKGHLILIINYNFFFLEFIVNV